MQMSDLSGENNNKKQRLGRGLGSLLGGNPGGLSSTDALPAPIQKSSTQPAKSAPQVNTQHVAQPVTPPPPQIPEDARIWKVAIDKIAASEYQPRTHFEKEKLEELAASIKQNGILQPIVARKLPTGRFEIIAGERRWRAAQIAGLHEVPIILKALENQAALELAIIENIQREDLNPIEEAEAYQRLASEFNLTQQQVAEKVGKDRATVANTMRLLALPQVVRDMVMKSEISAGHAKVLLSVPNMAKQIDLAKKILQQKVSVRQLEKMVASEAAEEKAANDLNIGKASKSQVPQKLISGMADELQKILGTKVSIDYMNSKGRISIHFYSDEELTQIVDHLKEGHG
jgi:ParB family chromosome partitioning protein